jgi:hypothetical protein
VGIRKKVKKGKHDTETDVTQPVFSYSNPGLAQLIVNAWTDTPPGFRANLLDRHPVTGLPTATAVKTATNAVNGLGGCSLKSAVVITEAEHDDDYTMQNPDEVVFVLPNDTRQPAPPPAPAPTTPQLLETAKLLMAGTPNGIERGCDSVSGEAYASHLKQVRPHTESRNDGRRALELGGFEWHSWSRSGSTSLTIFRSSLASRERFGFIPRAARTKSQIHSQCRCRAWVRRAVL